MNFLLKIIINDLKLIFRDQTLYIIFILPIAFILLCRFLVPLVTEYWYAEFTDYYWMVLAGLTCVSASTPAFLVSFILLDERDEKVETILQILPVPAGFIVKSRTMFMIITSFIFSVLILSFNGLIKITILDLLLISILFSLVPPILTFSISSIAKNKIEAAALYKGISMLLFFPIVAFFIHNNWRYGFGIIPFFWTFNAFELRNENGLFLLNFCAGLLAHIGFIVLFYRLYRKRTVIV